MRKSATDGKILVASTPPGRNERALKERRAWRRFPWVVLISILVLLIVLQWAMDTWPGFLIFN